MDLNQIKSELKNNYEIIFKKLGIEYEVLGENVYAKCPIHNNSDNPRAFSYCTKRGYWKCWTRNCQQDHKTDLLGLIAGVLSKETGSDVAFKDVISWVCEVLQIKDNKRSYVGHKNIKSINEDKYDDIINIVSIFNNQLPSSKKNTIKLTDGCVSSYFLSRGFSKETLEHFEVYEDINIPTLKDRASIPIYDDCGEIIVGLIGRSTKEYKIPKFLIFPKGFDKKFYLYNYHRAIISAARTSCLFVVEGQGDVWKLYEAGVENVVSIFGKDITKEQEEKIHRMPVTKLVVLTDNDQAGREAKVQIKRQFSRSHSIYFPKVYAKDIGEMSVKDIKEKILSQLEGLY